MNPNILSIKRLLVRLLFANNKKVKSTLRGYNPVQENKIFHSMHIRKSNSS